MAGWLYMNQEDYTMYTWIQRALTNSSVVARDLLEDSGPVWVDTVGWDDAECEDEETFKDILRHNY